MPTCPKGHDSADTDYCDECGTPIGGPSAPAGSGNGSAASPAATRPGTAATGEPCPTCATPRADRFCEVCGHDFVAAELSAAAGVAAGATPPGASSAGTTSPGGAAPGGAAPGGAGATSGGAASGGASSGGADVTSAPATGMPLPAREPAAATAWRVAVAADRAYHARMQAIADPGVEPIAFPAFCPERRFALHGPQMLIGRQSRSRGIEPDIDLTGPPTDPAVSHAHAMLVASPDGRWALVDLGSANGTYLNDGAEAIEENVPVPLSDGDRIHLGAFSTLTVHQA